jgi:hypothetical protein
MFTCERCGKDTGPKVSPIRIVVETKPKQYSNTVLDPESDDFFPVYMEKATAGSEIVLEEVICPACAGVEVKPQPRLDISFFQAASASANKHVRGCNKHLEDCKTCQQLVRWFRGVSAPVLSSILQASKAREFSTSLAYAAFGTFCDRTHDTSKRAACDTASAGAVLKQFEGMGGRL